MKNTLIALVVASIVIFSSDVNAQKRKYLSITAGLNQSTFYLQPGFFQEGEFEVLLDGPLFIGPELGVQFNLDFDRHHTAAISWNAVVYSRVVALALPINLSYFYHFLDNKNSPFIRVDGGYSFFLTSGAMYGFGAGYRLGRLRASFAYNNQLKNKSILEQNEFRTGRL
ncbi:MAG: hypothetical protein AAGJ93_17450, partial [Bacteroidota bacterium]